jgi:hypothetical protein
MKGLISLLVFAGLAGEFAMAQQQQPQTITKSASIVLRLKAPPEVAFPLFDPVNETKWDPEWQPQLLGAKVEEGLVFLTGDGRSRTTWLVDRYDPVAHRIAYVVTGHKTLTRILIDVQPHAGGSQATVTEIKTALVPEAVAGVEHFAQHFPLEQSHWEAAINGVLARGSTSSP